MARKAASDSIQGQIDQARAQEAKYDPPEGLEPLTDAEMVYWDTYCKAKPGWQVSELAELHVLCRMKVELDQIEEECKITPRIGSNAAGSPVEEPIHRVKRDHAKLIQGQLRLLGLNSRATVASTGEKAAQSRRGKRTPDAPAKPKLSLLG